jgi:Transposase DDE domain
MPLEVRKLSRSSRSKVCKEIDYTLPNKGYCASQNTHYYGYKLHTVCLAKGVFQSIDISPASVHDIHFLKDISQQMKDCTLLGDRGYLSTCFPPSGIILFFRLSQSLFVAYHCVTNFLDYEYCIVAVNSCSRSFE